MDYQTNNGKIKASHSHYGGNRNEYNKIRCVRERYPAFATHGMFHEIRGPVRQLIAATDELSLDDIPTAEEVNDRVFVIGVGALLSIKYNVGLFAMSERTVTNAASPSGVQFKAVCFLDE
jgi:hypothetical protein